MERGAPRTPLRFGRGAVKKWPTTPSFFGPLPPSRSGHGARCPVDGPVSRADHPRRVCRHLPAGLPTLPGSKSVLAAPGTPPPRGRELRPNQAGNSSKPTVHSGRSCRARAAGRLRYSPAGFSILPDSEPALAIPGASSPRGREPRPRRAGTDCPQRKGLSGPGSWASALLPCRFFHPAGQRAGFGHLRGITLVQADDSQAKIGPELPPADHLPQRALPDLGNRPPAPLPGYPPCWAANRSRLA